MIRFFMVFLSFWSLVVFSKPGYYDSLRDPTELPFSKVEKSNGLEEQEFVERLHVLEMIVIAEDDSYAVIDGDLFHVGDYLGFWKVKKINDYFVVLSSEKGERELKLTSSVLVPVPLGGV